jgi:signal transduction histidine kinase
VIIDPMEISVQRRSPDRRKGSKMSSPLSRQTPQKLMLAERLVEDEARRLVRTERLRLARELHDIVSYGFATIALQAGVAAHVAETNPEQAGEALRVIRDASRDVLDEIRAMLGQLREDDDAAEPARGIGRLGALAESTSSSGVRTTVCLTGPSRPLPIAVDLAAYRIVQEALANVLRHSPGAAACVAVIYETHGLSISIEDDGKGDPDTLTTQGSGYGIVGMRERATVLGGDLEAGPLPGGGFCINAFLPYREPR